MSHAECQVWSFTCKPKYRGAAFCLIQAFRPHATSREEAVLNDCDCALFALSYKVIATAACNEHQKSVSFVHQCSATCHFEEGPTPVQIEREQDVMTFMTLVTICIATTGAVHCLRRIY